MVTPLTEIDRRHIIIVQGYHGTHSGHVFQALIRGKIADEVVVSADHPSYLFAEFGAPAHSKNRGVLVDAIEGDNIIIVDRADPDTVLHTVTYDFGVVTTVNKV